MLLIPAIDILGGKAVRLLKGDKENATVYGDPVEIAVKFAEEGAQALHIVDLDGAFMGKPANTSIIRSIVDNVRIPLQLGGGIRNLVDIGYALNNIGVQKVILGTVVYENPDTLYDAIKVFGTRHIVCSIDAKDDKLAINGWKETVELTPLDAILDLREKGVDTIIYTDISKDGTLAGVNFERTVELAQKSGMNIIASGGIATKEDVFKLRDSGLIYGAILGKALYEKRFTLADVLQEK